MREIPTCEPREFVAGDTVAWAKSLADFSSLDGWTLSYRIVSPTVAIEAIDITAAGNDGGGWDVTIVAAKTATVGGVCRIIGWVTKAGERFTVYDDTIAALADVTTGTPASLQSPNQVILAAIDARLAGRITADQESVQIDGTALVRIPIKDLIVLRGIYAAKVWRDLNPGRSNPSHELRFVRAR